MDDVKRFHAKEIDRDEAFIECVLADDYDAKCHAAEVYFGSWKRTEQELDAQRLRADTAEAENKLLRHQLAASAQELRKASSWICREVEAGTTSATHWAIRLSTNADQIDAALNPKPEAGSHG